MTAFPGIPQEIWDSLIEGMALNKYRLLTGAGINSKCLGGDGEQIPTSKSLAEQLINDFGIPTDDEQIDLKRAYDYIEDSKDRNGRTRYQYFKERFSNCVPNWQSIIFKFAWKRIYTLNVDDLLEKAHQEYLTNAARKTNCRSFSWEDSFAEPDEDKKEIQIIHLHGYVSNEKKIIFSITEYLSAVRANHAWHPVFGDELLQEPFIIIGARLGDEIDLHTFIRRGNVSKDSQGMPSLIILNKITAMQRTEFVKSGLIPIESDAQTFVNALLEGLSEYEEKIGQPVRASDPESIENFERFIGGFKELKLDNRSQIIPSYHDFYAGYEPIWADILANYDVRFKNIENIGNDLSDILDGTYEQRLYYISGEPGSGKTAILFRVARDLISKGKRIFFFRSDERFSVQAVIWWLKHYQNSILMFDNVADFMAEIVDLCEKCQQEHVKLFIVAAERNTRESVIVQELAHTFLQKFNGRLGYLSDDDIDLLIKKLQTQSRLGWITRFNPKQQQYYFKKTSSRHLFSAMADLEGGQGFITRSVKEYKQEIGSEPYRQLYAFVCIAHTLGYALPISIASSLTGTSVNDIIDAINKGQLRNIIVLDPNNKGIKARHRVIASHVVQQALNQQERFQFSKSLSVVLSPHVTKTAIHQKTIYYRIIRELMDERLITDWLGNELAQRYYDEIRENYDWDARYWEQRALAEAKVERNLPRARSYAETALQRNKDHLSLNTLGTIMLKLSVSHENSDPTSAADAYLKGVAYLRESAKLANNRFPHPFTTYFRYTIDYIKLRYNQRDVERSIIREWDWWKNNAGQSIYFRDAKHALEVDKFNSEWLKLLTTQDKSN